MRYIHIIIIGLIVLLLGASAQAEERKGDGNELLSYCESGRPTGDFMWCYGYLSGILDLDSMSDGIPYFCVPSGVTMGQLRRVVVKDLQEHPEKLHWRNVNLTYIAIQLAFPCPVQSAPK